MRRFGWINLIVFILFLAGTVLVLANSVLAAGLPQIAITPAPTEPSGEDIVAGALLFDKWYAALGVQPPAGNMPIWTRQTTNTRSGADTWRCVECHGWDYKGVEGAYATGSHRTGFPNVRKQAEGMRVDEIVAHLKGAKDPAHDFSPYMDDTALTRLAVFLKFGTIDDTQYIDPLSLTVIGGNVAHGKILFDQICSACHGLDGKTIIFRSEGVDEYLGTVAMRDPFRFLHRTRFGTAGTKMPVGYTLGWSPSDGRDILAYAQTLLTGQELSTQQPGGQNAQPPEQVGGPAYTLWRGLFTGLVAFLGAVGFNILIIGLFIIIVLAVVWVLRKK